MPFVPGFNTNFVQAGLAEGVYTVRIMDNNTGCFGTATDEVKDGRVNPIVDIVEDSPLINCDPLRANGQLGVTADGGKLVGYSFDWYSGTAVTLPPGPLIVSNDKLIGQLAGNYVVRATNDLTGCFTDESGSITDGTVLPPIPNPLVERHRTSCIVPNGWVSVTVGGVVLNYTFDWYDGSAVSGTVDLNGTNYFDRDIGPYTVTATDLTTGCVSPPSTVTVEDKRVTPEFTFESMPSYCEDTGKPVGQGSVILNLTIEGVVLDEVIWYDVNSGAQVGTGTAVYELFPGSYRAEAVTTQGCTNEGVAEVKTEIAPYNGISKDNDGLNEGFIIDCISNFPDNNVKIFNRNGILVYEADGYDNTTIFFNGIGERGVYLQGIQLPVGTYFYIVDKKDGSKAVAGYLELDR